MSTNAIAAAAMVKGATIAMGDGSYFDLENPWATTMSIEDYAYALAYTVRSRGQLRAGGKRSFYGVGQHVVHGAEQMLRDGLSAVDALDFLMHESDEVVLGDMVGPAKPLLPDYRALARRCGEAIDARFNVAIRDKPLIKLYDIRMLATEKRDLMDFTRGQQWQWTDGYAPFDERIVPYAHPDEAAERFLILHASLSGTEPLR